MNQENLFSPLPPHGGTKVITVSELNRRARHVLEANLELLWIAGELSNVIRASSGHWYFSLKDSSAQVRCVMFRQRSQTLSFAPEDGMQVEIRALPTLYEARGEFQLGVETMRRAGLGARFEAFEQLKTALGAQGLFDEARKKPLPAFPARIGIITSLQAAALRDVITTLKRRAPMIRLILYPTLVQGADAAQEIVAALDYARLRAECDVLILCRGGGSFEDLWAFNEEPVARAMVRLQHETTIPLVSGIGHETDFSIADFIADRRAATPTAAAELVSPDTEELKLRINRISQRLRREAARCISGAQQHLDLARRGLISPSERLLHEGERLAQQRTRLARAWDQRQQQRTLALLTLQKQIGHLLPDLTAHRLHLLEKHRQLQRVSQRFLENRRQALSARVDKLALLSPLHTLARGYSIVTDVEGHILRNSTVVTKNTPIVVQLAKGKLHAIVDDIKT